MDFLLNRLSTPLTLGLFAISTISGVALFFHWGPGAFHSMHEWLSIVLLLPFALHIWKNWRAIVGYARRGALFVPVAASIVAALLFVAPGLSGGTRGGGPPQRAVLQLMTQSRLADLAPVLKTTPDDLLAALKARGYKVESTADTLDGVARSSGVPATELLFGALPH